MFFSVVSNGKWSELSASMLASCVVCLGGMMGGVMCGEGKVS